MGIILMPKGGNMTGSSPQEITQILNAWCNGDRAALDRLMPLVYDQLRNQAHRYLAHQRDGQRMQTTDLVNEVYLELANAGQIRWQNRLHFYAICAKLMRRILVHVARSRNCQKRGGRFVQVPLDEVGRVAPEPTADVVKLNSALEALEEIDPRKARVVELRFFGGLTLAETAEELKVSADTVWRDWDLAKAWLYREIRKP